jgi:hypothetical protein
VTRVTAGQSSRREVKKCNLALSSSSPTTLIRCVMADRPACRIPCCSFLCRCVRRSLKSHISFRAADNHSNILLSLSSLLSGAHFFTYVSICHFQKFRPSLPIMRIACLQVSQHNGLRFLPLTVNSSPQKSATPRRIRIALIRFSCKWIQIQGIWIS